MLVALSVGWNIDPYIGRTRNLLLVQESVIVSTQANAKRRMSADLSQVMNCIACLEVPGSMGNGLLIYMMVMDARQRNEANRAISIGKRHTDCPTRLILSKIKGYRQTFSFTLTDMSSV